MSINNDKNIEPLTELGLAFGYSNHRRRTFMSDDSGAGANAGSGLNMTFVTNTLSELVWSPLKGPSNVALLPVRRFTNTATKIVDDEDFLTPCEMKNGCPGKDHGSANFPIRGTYGDANIADTRQNQLSTFSGQDNEKTSEISSKPDKIRAEAVSGSPVDEDKKRSKKIESTSENELENIPKNEALVRSEIPQKSKGTCRTSKAIVQVQAKGKEKALSEGDQNAMALKNDDDDDSHESVESCNSAGLFGTGKRRRSFEEGLDSGDTKVFKKQMCHGQDSSFMNWISNVMKGFSHSVQERAPLPLNFAAPIDGHDNPDRALVTFDGNNREPPGPGPRNITGFQSMFQSLYCSKAEARETRDIRVVVGDGSNKTSDDNLDKRSDDKIDDGGGDSNTKLSPGKRKTNSEDDSGPPSLGKATTSTSRFRDRNDALGSFWITRFSPRARNNADMAAEEEEESVMSLNKQNPILPFPDSKPSDARRLDALKHVVVAQTTTTGLCFFCGEKGHSLGDCSEVKEIEREELMKNLDSCKTIKESPNCLCIKCYGRDHWAVSCPNKVEYSSFKETHIDLGNEENPKKLESDQSATPLEEKKCYVASSFVENVPRENQRVSLPLFVAAGRNDDAPRDLFDVVRRLRFSRSDIIKWTDSRISVSHIEGFFLRLRLGKWEEGLGGTGYHVACIIGSQKDDKQKGAKSSLLVKVGGMKCVVESRYISNNDFLEDELKAWWYISSRNGDKIPSEEDLRLKVKTKTKLGF